MMSDSLSSFNFTPSTILWAFCRTDRRFQLHKCSQPLIRSHNETLSVVAICVSNPDPSPVVINRCDTTPTPTGFAEFVSDDFPVAFQRCFSWQSFWKRGSERNGSQ